MSSLGAFRAAGMLIVLLFPLCGTQAGNVGSLSAGDAFDRLPLYHQPLNIIVDKVGTARVSAQSASDVDALRPRFCLDDLGLLENGEPIYPTDLNDHGGVAGNSVNGKAFFYQDGQLRFIEPLPGDATVAVFAINNAGVIIGNSIKSGADAKSHPFSYQDGRSTPLAGLSDAIPYAINEHGQIVGADRELGAFLYQQGSISVLQKPGSAAYAVNGNGDIAGLLDDGKAFVWRHGIVQTISVGDNAVHGEARDINEHGTVVGFFTRGDTANVEAFMFTQRHGAEVLGTLAEADTYGVAMSINNNGVVVGHSGISDDFFATSGLKAFIYQDGAMFDLNTCVKLPPDVTLTAAVAINERGQIAARGARDQTLRAFLLTPLREGTTCDQPGDRRPGDGSAGGRRP